jgi:hypothetical protein
VLSRPIAILRWTIGTFLKIFDYPGGLAAFGLGAWLYVVGSISLYRRDNIALAALSLPIFFTFLAAFLGKYPVTDRLILFMIPLLLIPVAAGIEELLKLLSPSPFRLACPILVLIIFFQPLVETSNYLTRPKLKEEIRPVIEHIHANWQDGDMIYVYYGALKQFKYYQPRYNFQESDYILGIESRYEWINYLPDLNKLQEHRRVWLLFSHVHSGDGVNEEALFVKWLQRTGGTQKDWFPRAGASVYLYEF